MQPGLLGWSLPFGRVAGIELRAHWSLLLMMAVQAFQALAWSHWWLLPALLLIPFVSVLLHEFGHSLMARLVGGDSRLIVMWAFGGLAYCEVPHSWGREFIVAAAGPFVTFAIMACCGLLADFDLSRFAFVGDAHAGSLAASLVSWLLAYAASLNLYLLLFNLLPCYPMDGGRMCRALLWPLLGERRAVMATIYIAYVLISAGLAYALLSSQAGLAILAMLGLLVVYTEHRQIRYGLIYDPPAAESPNWLDRRRRRQAQAQREAAQRKAVVVREAEEQRLRRLDELLEKVSRQGLPSLTDGERAFLRSCSEEERKRSGAPR